jgi:hypothetical protein
MGTRGQGSLLAYSSAPPADVQAAPAAGGSSGAAAGSGACVHSVLFEYDERCGALRMEVPPGLPLEVDWAVSFA